MTKNNENYVNGNQECPIECNPEINKEKKSYF